MQPRPPSHGPQGYRRSSRGQGSAPLCPGSGGQSGSPACWEDAPSHCSPWKNREGGKGMKGTGRRRGGHITSCPWQPLGSPCRTRAAGSARKTRTAEQGDQMVEVQWSTNPTKYGQRGTSGNP